MKSAKAAGGKNPLQHAHPGVRRFTEGLGTRLIGRAGEEDHEKQAPFWLQPPARPAKPLVPALDVDAFVAHVFAADAWRVRTLWRTEEQFGRGVLSFRVQHDEGTGPAAFVDWQVEAIASGEIESVFLRPEQRVRGWSGEIDALFVGSEHDVRAALGRLDEWLLPHGWERAKTWGSLLWALRW